MIDALNGIINVEHQFPLFAIHMLWNTLSNKSDTHLLKVYSIRQNWVTPTKTTTKRKTSREMRGDAERSEIPNTYIYNAGAGEVPNPRSESKESTPMRSDIKQDTDALRQESYGGSSEHQ